MTNRSLPRYYGNHASRTRPVRRAPPRLNRFTAKVFEGLAQQTRYMEPKLAARWHEIAGEEIAKLCWPSRLLRDGSENALEVVTQTGSAATALNYMTPELLRRLALELGPGTVTRITIRQQGFRPKPPNSQLAPQPMKRAEPLKRESQAPSPLEDVLAKYRKSIEKKNS